MKLIENKPSRIFTFGCSFTNYVWPTWANILAFDLNLPLYNYGRGGAGNQYIFNMLMQADNYFKFNSNDLVIVCWTNISREDRYFNGQWHTPGNIYTQQTYDSNFIKRYADETNHALRDLAVIKASYEFLKAKQITFHFLKILDLQQACQWNTINGTADNRLYQQYQEYLDCICPSYYDVLWKGNVRYREELDRIEIDPRYQNGHPMPYEHLHYLQAVFDKHKFSDYTINAVNNLNLQLINNIRKQLDQGIAQVDMRFPNLQLTTSEAIQAV